ncbi:hypothetical protein DUI87_17790 [Hirundo rustica rustica]|uniref:Uncharacterized protein n=1 Tax=Hirundo rustica rustica TaxID=333673 RepID=A0A3M0JUA5_HIRRU|nr:hypothetical protein DUI87_17790 [Hirundo rustica rustica]
MWDQFWVFPNPRRNSGSLLGFTQIPREIRDSPFWLSRIPAANPGKMRDRFWVFANPGRNSGSLLGFTQIPGEIRDSLFCFPHIPAANPGRNAGSILGFPQIPGEIQDPFLRFPGFRQKFGFSLLAFPPQIPAANPEKCGIFQALGCSLHPLGKLLRALSAAFQAAYSGVGANRHLLAMAQDEVKFYAGKIWEFYR